MPIPCRPRFSTPDVDRVIQVTDDGSRTVVCLSSEDAYHSGCGAVAETRHVYLHNSGVRERLQANRPTRILEVGLGTGMGLLLTLSDALQHDTPLDYVALENDWLRAELLQQLQPESWTAERSSGSLLEPSDSLVEQWIQWRQSLGEVVRPGRYGWTVDDRRRVLVELTDAQTWRPDAASLMTQPASFHAVYFDPFAPASNPELWTESVLAVMHEALTSGGKLVTYCCSRAVRDALSRVGFQVDRTAGPVGGKREVLIATKTL